MIRKFNHPLSKSYLYYHSQGQLSIFLGISLLIIITMIAFIVNVGLFVKAKINLQNAVDAAAWSGAAVQSKQLTNIAYMNWELRNIYKEWMFKYYVLGQLSLNKTRLTSSYAIKTALPPTGQGAGGVMNFRMDPMFPNPGHDGYSTDAYDRYNLPSVCIHFGKTGHEFNICEVYDVPGLPRFPAIELPGISEHLEVFLNNIVEVKAADCSWRTNLNFQVALMWAFGTGRTIFHGSPEIASNRPGAWPKAFEIAIRIRNMERFVNRPPITEGITVSGSKGRKADSLDGLELPINERPIKAFWSAYRNLNPEMQQNFTLQEISPQAYQPPDISLSSYLIPPTAENIDGVLARTKYYLDLQMMPLNYVTFFTSFVTRKAAYAGVQTEAACAGSKTGLPVPGYILGFTKNPDVLTYYAVKGETKFIGLFYPFSDQEGIAIKAYAAAKPFGGRIGPRLFKPENETQIMARGNGNSFQFRSLPYASGLKIPYGGVFKPGLPIPYNLTSGKFWVESDKDAIGGVPGTGVDVVFAVPNLLYDYETTSAEFPDTQALSAGMDTIQVLEPAAGFNDRNNIKEAAGLYDRNQFKLFASQLVPVGSNTMIDANSVEQALQQVRRPTKYEALNYLIPTNRNGSSDPVDSIADVPGSFNGDPMPFTLRAPFFGNMALHKNRADILSSVGDYIAQNDHAIETFLNAMKTVHDSIIANASTYQDPKTANAAANEIWDPNLTCIDPQTKIGSLAGNYHQFFRGTGTICDITPLSLAIEEFWADELAQNPDFSNFYTIPYIPALETYSPPSGTLDTELHSAYAPGPRQGATEDGEINQSNMIAQNQPPLYGYRNFYSTKLVSMKSLTNNLDQPFPSYGEKPFYQEHLLLGNALPDVYLSGQPEYKNPLMIDDLEEFGDLTH